MFLYRFSAIVLLFTLMGFSLTVHAADYMAEAEQYMQKGEYKTAIIQLKNHLIEVPDDAQARFLLGQSYQKTGDINGAYSEFEKAYKISKNDSKIRLAYVSALMLKNDKEKIKELLAKSYEDKSEESQRLVILAEVALSENEFVDAAKLLNEAEIINNTIDVQLALAKLALAEKDNTKAEQIVDVILSKDNNSQKALYLKAKILSLKEEYKQAIAVLDVLHKVDPENLRYLLDRAGIKYREKDYKGAEQDLSVVLKNSDNQPTANYIMSLVKLYQVNYLSASQYAHKVLNIIPEHYPSMFVLGVAEFKLGNLNQAEKFLNQVLFQSPDNLQAQSVLSNLYIAKKEGDQALLLLESIDKDKIAESANLSLSLGTAYLLTGDYKKAILALNNAKKLAPDNKLIDEQLATVYFKSKDSNEAIVRLEAIAVDKDNKRVQYLLVVTYIQNKEFDKAKETIERLKIQSPDDPNLYNFQAALYLINKNKELALSSYSKAIEIDGNYIPAYVGTARIYMEDKQYAQADDSFKKILTIDNKYVKAWLGRASIAEHAGDIGQVEFFIKEGLKNSNGDVKSELIALQQLAVWYVKQGEKDKVLELGREISQRYPKNAAVQFFQARTLLLNGKDQQAEIVLEKLLYNDPDNRKYQLLLMSVLLQNKENLKVVEVSQYYQQLFPEDALGYQLEGDALFAEKRYEKALEKYHTAFKKDSTNKLLLKITNLYVSQNKNNEAIEFLNNVVAEENTNISARSRLAILLQKQKKNVLAIEQYQVILNQEAENVLALNNLAWMLSEQGDEQALKYGKKAYELKPDSPAIIDTYGYILLKENRPEEGLKILQKAANLAPKSYDIHYHLAKAYFLTGETKKAKETLRVILNGNADFPEKENAKILFSELQ